MPCCGLFREQLVRCFNSTPHKYCGQKKISQITFCFVQKKGIVHPQIWNFTHFLLALVSLEALWHFLTRVTLLEFQEFPPDRHLGSPWTAIESNLTWNCSVNAAFLDKNIHCSLLARSTFISTPEISKDVTQLPTFTHSWKLLCTGYLRKWGKSCFCEVIWIRLTKINIWISTLDHRMEQGFRPVRELIKCAIYTTHLLAQPGWYLHFIFLRFIPSNTAWNNKWQWIFTSGAC